MKVKCESEVTQSCLTFCDPIDCSPPGSSTHGILQARVLEWVAIVFSEGIMKALDLQLSQTEIVGNQPGELQEMVKDREAWHTAVCRVAESDTILQLNNNNKCI